MLSEYEMRLLPKYGVNRPSGLGGVREQTDRQTYIHTEDLPVLWNRIQSVFKCKITLLCVKPLMPFLNFGMTLVICP